MRLRTLALLAFCLLTLPASAQISPFPFDRAVTPNLNSANVSVLNTNTHTEIARIAVGPRPHKVAMSPNGRFAYVGEDGFGAPQIVINEINLLTPALTRTVTLASALAHLIELEVSPNGKWLAAVDIQYAKLFLIDTSTFTIASTIQLCQTCTNPGQAIYSPAQVVFTSNSALLYAAVPSQDVVQVVDPAAGVILSTIPLVGYPGVYADIRLKAGDDVHAHVMRSGGSSLRVVDTVAGTVVNLPLIQGSTNDIEFIPGTNLLATSSIVYDPNADFLEVLDVTTGLSTLVPSVESVRGITYNPATKELWAICNGFVGYCVPYEIDIFNASTLTHTATITGLPSFTFVGLFPSFTQSNKHFYHPLGNNTVLVVDVATRAVVTQIPVGSNPRGVYMQGAWQPKEL